MSLTFNHQTDSLIASSGIISLNANTGALTLPTSGTSHRPTSPMIGMIRYNSDGAGNIEIYNGTAWSGFSSGLTGPSGSLINAIPTWANTSGNQLQNTQVLIDGSNNVSGVNSISGTSLNFNSGSLTSGTIGSATITNAALSNGSVSGSFQVQTVSASDSSQNAATTAYVQNNLGSYATTASLGTSLANYVTNSSLTSTLGSYATVSSVNGSLANYATVSSVNGSLANYALTSSVVGYLSYYAPLASPALTGAPTAPNPSTGNNSTQIATTAWVQANPSIPATFGIGAIVLARPSGGTLAAGSVIAGSSLSTTYIEYINSSTSLQHYGSDSLAGTWRALQSNPGSAFGSSLFQRIA